MTIFSKFFPIPGAIQDRSSVNTLKKRLDWGEPALTIIGIWKTADKKFIRRSWAAIYFGDR